MEVISWTISTLLSWYVWLPIVLLLGYLTWRNYQRIDAVKAIESTLLILEIPKANDKKELAAEQLFASLHGILRDKDELKLNGGIQEHLSFEIASVNGQIRFYVWVPKALQSFVEGQIYAQYPTVQIHEADEDYVAHERNHSVVYTGEMALTASEFLPIKTFQSFEVDPLAGITGTLAKLESTGEEVWIQVLARPVPDSWHKAADSWANTVKNGNPFGFLSDGKGLDFKWIGSLLEAFWKPPEQSAGAPKPKELSERDKTRISEAQKKATKLGYQVVIRLAYLGESTVNAKLRMQAIVGTFKQYNSTNLNGFKVTNTSFKSEDLAKYRSRLFIDKGFILNIEELASVFHLPHTNVETPNIVWANNKTAEPPSKLPVITGNSAIDENISAFGLTNFRGINHQFGMLRYDRSRHVYIIGQTGAGKSGTLELFALSDIFHNQGYAIIDPHGDFAINNMKFIPASRLQDVIYFNPADTSFPLGFNPLEVINPNMKSNISSEVIGVLERMFSNSWGPRLEYILRYTILALLDRPETTMLDITRMLTDKKFRKETLSYCTDTVVLQFWNVEFNSWTEKFQAEAIAPILNKVGAFTANPIIRNIIGQPKSTFNIRQIMDEGKILIVNLSKGLLGEDNSSILGSFLVTKIQLAAMSRSDIPDIKDRRPFYLYVDEFQNFATNSFATILSEARKYALNLTVANQYISQMDDTVRNAVFGNVGTMITFRVSADDAPILAKQFAPQFEDKDLLQMANRSFVINMVINGEKAPAFSARTLELPPPQTDNTATIIDNTRARYSRPRADIEAEISQAMQPLGQNSLNNQKKQSDKDKAPESAAMAAKWPINAQSQTITPDQPPKAAPIATAPAAEEGSATPVKTEAVATPPPDTADQPQAPPKKKRSRNRKRKPAADDGTPAMPEHPATTEQGSRSADSNTRDHAPRDRDQPAHTSPAAPAHSAHSEHPSEQPIAEPAPRQPEPTARPHGNQAPAAHRAAMPAAIDAPLIAQQQPVHKEQPRHPHTDNQPEKQATTEPQKPQRPAPSDAPAPAAPSTPKPASDRTKLRIRHDTKPPVITEAAAPAATPPAPHPQPSATARKSIAEKRDGLGHLQIR